MIGVQVRLSQLVNDIVGGVTSLASGIAGAVGNALIGNYAGAVISAASGIQSTAQSMLPQLSTRGTEGSFLGYSLGAPKLHAFYNLQFDTDPDRYGRPLCEVKYLGDLDGYCLCSNAVVNYVKTLPLSVEAEEVNGLLNSGVYIE